VKKVLGRYISEPKGQPKVYYEILVVFMRQRGFQTRKVGICLISNDGTCVILRDCEVLFLYK